MRMLSGVGRGWGVHYNTVLLRASLREMTDLVTLIDSIVRPIWGKAVSYNKLNHVYEWKTGEKLELNYFLDMSSLDLYYGKQFAVVAWEELDSKNPLKAIWRCSRRCAGHCPRPSCPGMSCSRRTPAGLLTTLSLIGSISAAFLKARGQCIVDAKTGETRRIIHCSFEDNSLLKRTTPNYIASIEQACEGNEPMLQAFRYGNWSIVAGGCTR